MSRAWKYLKYILPIAILVAVLGLEILSHSAAMIFNREMEQQDMLRGKITVGKLMADLTGRVSFENLEWRQPNGELILSIPDGSFRVRIWDVVTRNFKSTTIQELKLNGADISVHLDDNMQVDFVGHSPEFNQMNQMLENDPDAHWEKEVSLVGKSEEELMAIGEEKRRRQQEKMAKQWANFNRDGRKLQLKLLLDRCRIEVFYRQRHYLLSGVRFDMDLDTDREMQLTLKTGSFGGMMIGRGMVLRGTVDFTQQPVPECNISVLLQEVNPSSLGFGMNINDEVTLQARFAGPVSHPTGDGLIRMDELHIPGLDFKGVSGSIHYEDGKLDFSDVIAQVYGGTLSAMGDYHIDTRYYHIYGKGEKLKASHALRGAHLHCEVALNLEIDSKGSPAKTVTSGSFVSGEGRYRFMPFQQIRGSFSDFYRDLHFYDVVIDLGSYRITTDAFQITDGKLTLSPIHLEDAHGQTVMTYGARGES